MLNKVKSALGGKIFYIVPIIALLAAGCGSSKPEEQQSPQENNTKAEQPATTTQPTNISSPTWHGVLQLSNNPEKGNLMLIQNKSTIYFNTSRDFSALIGKTVNISYQGSLTGFKLGEITESK